MQTYYSSFNIAVYTGREVTKTPFMTFYRKGVKELASVVIAE